jgi:hypothetical protein
MSITKVAARLSNVQVRTLMTVGAHSPRPHGQERPRQTARLLSNRAAQAPRPGRVATRRSRDLGLGFDRVPLEAPVASMRPEERAQGARHDEGVAVNGPDSPEAEVISGERHRDLELDAEGGGERSAAASRVLATDATEGRFVSQTTLLGFRSSRRLTTVQGRIANLCGSPVSDTRSAGTGLSRRGLALVLMLLTACSFGDVSHRSSGTSRPTAPFIRGCDSSVFGMLARGWRDDALVIGPLAFAYLPSFASPKSRHLFRAPGGRYRGQKVLAIVETGPDVTVRVPAWEQDRLSLLYGPAGSKLGRFNVSEGESSVRFVPCNRGESPFGTSPILQRETQFNGGFIVAGAQCAALDISVGDGASQRVWVSFGMGRRCPL